MARKPKQAGGRAAAAWAGVVGVGVLALGGFAFWLINGRDECTPEITLAGKGLDFEAAAGALQLKAKTSPTAQHVIGEKLQFYANRAADLCRDRKAGRLSDADYTLRKDEAAAWFMEVRRVVESGKLQSLPPEEAGALRDILGGFRTQPAAEPLATVILTDAKGRVLPTNPRVKRGDRLRLRLEGLGASRFVYVMGVGTSGGAYRIFPSSLVAGGNPVSGRLEIPQHADRYLEVGGPAGRETLYVFVSDRAEPELAAIGEIVASGQAPPAVARSVERRAVLRDLFAEPPPPAPASAPLLPKALSSRFGAAARTIELINEG